MALSVSLRLSVHFASSSTPAERLASTWISGPILGESARVLSRTASHCSRLHTSRRKVWTKTLQMWLHDKRASEGARESGWASERERRRESQGESKAVRASQWERASESQPVRAPESRGEQARESHSLWRAVYRLMAAVLVAIVRCALLMLRKVRPVRLLYWRAHWINPPRPCATNH